KRNIARFLIRTSQECELHLTELIRILQDLGFRNKLLTPDYKAISERLSMQSPYRTRSFPLRRVLAALNFVDSAGVPTVRLRAIWESGKAYAVPGKKPLPRKSAARPERVSPRQALPIQREEELPNVPQEARTVFVGNLP